MFGIQFSGVSQRSTTFADPAALISMEIAYAPAMSNATITVTDDGGILVLEGSASPSAIVQAMAIAERFFGGHVCNLIRADQSAVCSL